MALSLSNFLLPISLLASVAHAATVTHDFDVGWVYANPDGLQTRPVMGINGQWPIPPIVANVGDQVVINVKNSLGNESTSLHFHGLYMNGTTHMDGPVAVSQCGIPPNGHFTYNFTVNCLLLFSIEGNTDRNLRSTSLARIGVSIRTTDSFAVEVANFSRPLSCTRPIPRWSSWSSHHP